MGISNILHQFPEASEIHWENDHTICCPTLYVALQMVLKMLLVFIMLVQIPGKVRIMGKSKIICHIMHHFAKPAPVNALLASFGIIVNKSFHLTLDFLEGAEIFMLLCKKRWLDIRKNASKAERLSVGLQTLSGRHLVCQISGYQYMGFFTQPLPLLSCSYPL